MPHGTSSLLLGGTLGLYLLGAALLGIALTRGQNWTRIAGWVAAGLGAILHFLAIGFRCAELHRAPFVTPAESLSLLAWLLVLLYLGAQALWKLTAAGTFALSLAFLLVFLAGRLGNAGGAGGAASPLLAEQAVSLHVVAILAAFGAFALAFCCAGLYLVEQKLLKGKQGLLWLKRLPPLATVDRAALTLVGGGFPLLTVGILSGLLRALGGGLHAGWATDPKLVLAYAVWVVYASYLLVRLCGNWPPARASLVLLAGLILCMFVFLFPTSIHKFN